MLLTKTQVKVMKLAVSSLTKKFGIREIARLLKMNNSLAHRTIKPLIDEKLFLKDEKGYLQVDLNANHDLLAFCEYLRRNDFLQKDKKLSLLNKDIIEKYPFGYFVLLIFGSTVISAKPGDLDLLLIIENTKDIEQAEKYLYNITNIHSLSVHPVVVSFESVYEMLSARDEKNVINEVMNKHIILYGAELFYRLLKRGRK